MRFVAPEDVYAQAGPPPSGDFASGSLPRSARRCGPRTARPVPLTERVELLADDRQAAQRLLGVDGRVVLPLLRHLVLGEDGLDGAFGAARVAVNAGLRVNPNGVVVDGESTDGK